MRTRIEIETKKMPVTFLFCQGDTGTSMLGHINCNFSINLIKQRGFLLYWSRKHMEPKWVWPVCSQIKASWKWSTSYVSIFREFLMNISYICSICYASWYLEYNKYLLPRCLMNLGIFQVSHLFLSMCTLHKPLLHYYTWLLQKQIWGRRKKES